MEENSKELASLDKDQKGLVVPLDDTNELFLLKCPKCSAVHFRHAGYMVPMLPFADPRKPQEVSVSSDQKPVQICVACKTAVLVHDAKVYNVTKHVDLEAWEKTEKEAHKATGPGGQC